MEKIVYTVEFDDEPASDRANDLLEKGWILIHVGTKLVDVLENGQAYYLTSYVVGANATQRDEYLQEQELQEGESDFL